MRHRPIGGLCHRVQAEVAEDCDGILDASRDSDDRGRHAHASDLGRARIGEESLERRLFVAADVGRRDPHAHGPVAASRVFDQVGEGLRDRSTRDPGEEVEHLGCVASGIQCATDGGCAEAVDDGAARALDIRHEPQLARDVRKQGPGCDGREVCLEQDVVEGLRHRGTHHVTRGGRIHRRVAPHLGKCAAACESEDLQLIHDGDDVLAALRAGLSWREVIDRADHLRGIARSLARGERCEDGDHLVA